MLEPRDLFEYLIENDIRFFSGVPDSLLKNFCAYVSDNCNDSEHIISAEIICSLSLQLSET